MKVGVKKVGVKGYAIIEMIIAAGIALFISSASGAFIYNVYRNASNDTNRMDAVHQVEIASYWISRDARAAFNVTAADDLTPPEFLSVDWTEWDDDNQPVYHTANYTLVELSDGIGKLSRSHIASDGTSEQTVVARHIYYDLSDTESTSNTSYQDYVLTVKLTAEVEDKTESREYRVKLRTDF